MLKGKVIGRIEEIIETPRPQVYGEYIEDVARSPAKGQYLMKMVLLDKRRGYPKSPGFPHGMLR